MTTFYEVLTFPNIFLTLKEKFKLLFDEALEKDFSTYFSLIPLYIYIYIYMAKQKQNDKLTHTQSSYVRIQDVALKTFKKRWMIGRSGERGSGISVLAARHDDIYIYICVCACVCVCVCVCARVCVCVLVGLVFCLNVISNLHGLFNGNAIVVDEK